MQTEVVFPESAVELFSALERLEIPAPGPWQRLCSRLAQLGHFLKPRC